jgi:carbon monoxide dehydrogenase subunit G
VKIAGKYEVAAPLEQVYEMLLDPAVLARSMPGCEALDPAGVDEYSMRMKMVLASMSGLFQGRVRIADPNPPVSYRLIVEGTGKIGFMKGEGVLTLSASTQPQVGQASGNVAQLPADVAQASAGQPASYTSTTVSFEGDVQVGGTIAAVGQRLVETTARMLIKRFFDKLNAEASAATPQPISP